MKVTSAFCTLSEQEINERSEPAGLPDASGGIGGTVDQTFNTGAVSGSFFVGGVAGGNMNSTSVVPPNLPTISNSYSTGSVTASSYAAGGVVGDVVLAQLRQAHARGGVEEAHGDPGAARVDGGGARRDAGGDGRDLVAVADHVQAAVLVAMGVDHRAAGDHEQGSQQRDHGTNLGRTAGRERSKGRAVGWPSSKSERGWCVGSDRSQAMAPSMNTRSAWA